MAKRSLFIKGGMIYLSAMNGNDERDEARLKRLKQARSDRASLQSSRPGINPLFEIQVQHALIVHSHTRPLSIQLDMTRTSQTLTKVEEYAQLLDKFDTFLFDCDGVIWTGPKLVPGVTDVLNLLRSRGECGIHSSLRSDADSLAGRKQARTFSL